MRPDEHQQGRVGTSPIPQRAFVDTPPSRDPSYRQQQAAANVVRSQLDDIYAGVAVSSTPQTTQTPAPAQQQSSTATPSARSQPEKNVAPVSNTTELEDINPYERTHTPNAQPQVEQWKQYHSAWQNYYQKYYEGYYTKHLKQTEQALEKKLTAPIDTTHQAFGASTEKASSPDTITRDQALYDLRQKLRNKVQDSAKKVRKSRHFIPIVASFSVVAVFLFLQYNQVLIANVQAYITPGSIDPQNIVVDPTVEVSVGPEARLIIPKINVDTPVFYDIGTDQASQLAAMENGVAHFPIAGASSHPGEVGNTVLSGHSSNDVFAAGDYKFIFAQLEKVNVGDTIYANYNSKRYTYVVSKKEIVLPTEVNKLVYTTDKPVLTLITCTPLGTALKRLLITAEQVSPDPTQATAAPTTDSSTNAQTSIPGQGEPTLIERIFGRS